MNGAERTHIDDHPAGRLGMAEGSVPLAARRDKQALRSRVREHSGDIRHRCRPQHRDRAMAHDVAEILGCPAQGSVVESECAAKLRSILEPALPVCHVAARHWRRRQKFVIRLSAGVTAPRL
jgi:hypothetical protein